MCSFNEIILQNFSKKIYIYTNQYKNVILREKTQMENI